MDIINCFDGDFAFLSNFFNCPVYYEGLQYQSSENAYQAAKVHIMGDPEATNILRTNIGFTVVTPGQAKRLGKQVQLREDWEAVKDCIMYEILRAKFTQNPELAQHLVYTYPAILIEGNTWHDNYWGNCVCPRCCYSEGKNTLGQLLMNLREELI